MRRALILAIIVLTLTSMALALYAIRAQRVATNRLDVDDPASGRSPRLIIWTTPQKLGESINSQQDEYEPRVHPDGSLLVFVRGRVDENADL